VATCRQSPYLHKPAIVTVTSFSLWRHSHCDLICCWAGHAHRYRRTYGHLTAFNIWRLEMWANAQRDGRPAEYRWRPLFNAAVCLTPTTRVPCSNAAKTRNPLKFAGVPKLTKRSHKWALYCGDMLRRYGCLTSFFRLSIHALVAKTWPDKVVGWCPDGDFLRPVFQRAAHSTFQTCILNSH